MDALLIQYHMQRGMPARHHWMWDNQTSDKVDHLDQMMSKLEQWDRNEYINFLRMKPENFQKILQKN